MALSGNVLVTGGRGFIGRNLVESLAKIDSVEKIYSVDVADIKEGSVKDQAKVNQIQTDLSSEDSVNSLPEDVDFVFALAAVNGTSRFYSEPFYVLHNSLLPTMFIIKKYSLKSRILYSSSSEVYSGGYDLGLLQIPTPEDIPICFPDSRNPRWSYGSAKALGEFAMHAAAKEFGLQGVIVRYHNVYGPDMGFNHFVPDFIERVLNGNFSIKGVEQTRSFIFVSDAIKATILAMEHSSNEMPCYHIGTSQEISIGDAAKTILRLLKLEEHSLKPEPAPSGSVARRCPDITKTSHDLMWRPTLSFEEGIREFLDWRVQPRTIN